MPDFIATRSFLYVAGNVISPVQNTSNEIGIYNPHNAAFDSVGGHTHTGTAGDGPILPAFNPATGHKHTGAAGNGPLINITSPASRVVTTNTGNLTATDVYVGVNYNGICTLTFNKLVAGNDFVRDVIVYDERGNMGTFAGRITFAGGWTCQGLTDIYITEDRGAIRFHYNGTNWAIV